MTYYSTPPRSDELWHHGIKGMRWGVRKYQNEDGSLTPAGERHYYRKDGSLKRRGKKRQAVVRDAYNYFKRAVDRDKGEYNQWAQNYSKALKKYGGKEGHINYLRERYGDKNLKSILSDPGNVEWAKGKAREKVNEWKNMMDEYNSSKSTMNRYRNLPIDLTEKEYKDAKSYAKIYRKTRKY